MKYNCKRNGCKDVFKAFLVEDAEYEGKYDIPVIIGSGKIPNRIISFSKALRSKNYNQWVHFFEDDCQFERIWNVYRSRAIGVWLEKNGINVLVNIRFGDDRTYAVSCCGVKKHSNIVIGTLGTIEDLDDRSILIEGIIYVLGRIQPNNLIVYGKVPSEIENYCYNKDIKIVAFESETTRFFREKAVKNG